MIVDLDILGALLSRFLDIIMSSSDGILMFSRTLERVSLQLSVPTSRVELFGFEDFVDVGFDFGELFAAVGEELGGCFDFGG